MARPYLSSNIGALRQLFENSRNDKEVLEVLHEELTHRTRPKAVTLRNEVQEVLRSLDKKRPAEKPSSDRSDSRDTAETKKPDLGPKLGPFPKPNNGKDPQPNLDLPDDATDQGFSHDFRQVEPTKTAAGHPSKTTFPLKEEVKLKLPSDAPLCKRYVEALDLLVLCP